MSATPPAFLQIQDVVKDFGGGAVAFELPAGDAFGPRNPQLVQRVARALVRGLSDAGFPVFRAATADELGALIRDRRDIGLAIIDGETDEGPSPMDTLLIALAGCTGSDSTWRLACSATGSVSW